MNVTPNHCALFRCGEVLLTLIVLSADPLASMPAGKASSAYTVSLQIACDRVTCGDNPNITQFFITSIALT